MDPKREQQEEQQDIDTHRERHAGETAAQGRMPLGRGDLIGEQASEFPGQVASRRGMLAVRRMNRE